MRIFAVGIEYRFHVVIERPQHADVRMDHEVATLGGADQTAHGGLPFLELLFSLR
jgi:hypothetical protein